MERLEHGAELLVSLGADWVLVLGPAEELPWADGVTYLGHDGGLLLPCALSPSVPAGVLRAAVGVDALAVLRVCAWWARRRFASRIRWWLRDDRHRPAPGPRAVG